MASGVTFSGDVILDSGEATPTLSGDYFSGGVSVAATLATSLVGSPVANTFPPSTTVSIQDGTLNSYAAIPLIPNVVAYSLGDNLFNVGSGGVLSIASEDKITSGDALVVESGGTLVAEGVTFSGQVTFGSGSSGTVEFDTFTNAGSGCDYFDGQMQATVTNDNFAASKAAARRRRRANDQP